MAAAFEEMPGSFVVIFFATKSGEIRCRVTDVATRETWIAQRPSALRHFLVERLEAGDPGEEPN